jgi:hypothetical protein
MDGEVQPFSASSNAAPALSRGGAIEQMKEAGVLGLDISEP